VSDFVIPSSERFKIDKVIILQFLSGFERFVFDAKRRRFVLFEEIEGEAAEDGEGFYGVSSSDARVILHSAIALKLPIMLCRFSA
jgi:hypothetical protein